MSILKATYRVAERAAAAAHVGTATEEEQVPRANTIHGTRPIDADGANKVERTIAVVAVAGNGQFKWRGKSTGCIVAAPALAF